MAGTPIAPMLATLYLRDLDEEVVKAGATYARYSDDILVLVEHDELRAFEDLLRIRLVERGLAVNEQKSGSTAPGEAWDFLGFRYHRGAVGLAPISERKVKTKATRLARNLLRWRERNNMPAGRAVNAFIRRTNARVYRVQPERAAFSWATWFLPLLDEPSALMRLDQHVQREVRYAATGRRTARARQVLPYSALVDAGYLPLATAWWALRQGTANYDALVLRRTTQPASSCAATVRASFTRSSPPMPATSKTTDFSLSPRNTSDRPSASVAVEPPATSADAVVPPGGSQARCSG